jgi:phosphoribosylanthranilate isomerase
MVRVKICGITNSKDALAAQRSGCDAVGFVFFKKSQRSITPRAAQEIAGKLGKKIFKVGVFVDEREKAIKDIAQLCGLDILQFHGSESPAFCARFKGCRVVKAFRVKDAIDIDRVLRYKTYGYLFDTFAKVAPGGTGKSFDWDLLRSLGGLKKKIFLSGGLNNGNVRKAIETCRPDWVDVSTSVESKPGKKDPQKVRAFIKAVKV